MNTLPDDDNAVLQIFLSGNNVISGPGFDITAGGSTIRGLVVSGFWGAPEINLRTNGNNTVEGCFIGTNVDATAGVPGANIGIKIDGVAGNTIGGTTPAKRNVISRNNFGVVMQNAGATNNTVLGNFIGTDRTGTVNLGNSQNGVFINVGSNTIGGTTSGARNVISANSEGIHVEGSVSGTTIQGNFIGLKVNGTEALGNSTGIFLFNGVTNTTIGGTIAAARNIISANTTGIYLTVANSNSIQGNYIGTDKNGSAALGNSQSGVRVENGATNNIIGSSDSTTPGGACTGGCNLISGNNTGVNFFDTSGAGNVVISNYIGTDATGTVAISNFNNGVNVSGTGMIIGGTTAAERNIISGSINANGVALSGSASINNIVQGNFIGTNSAGTAALGNAGWGCVSIMPVPAF